MSIIKRKKRIENIRNQRIKIGTNSDNLFLKRIKNRY